MGKMRRQLLLNSLKLYDLVVMVCCFLLAISVGVHRDSALSLSQVLSMRIRLVNFLLFSGFVGLWHATFVLFGLYDSRRLLGRRADIIDICKAATLGAGLVLAAGLVFRIRLIQPSFAGIFWISALLATVTSRMVLRSILEQVRLRGRNLRYMVVVGTNPRAVTFAKQVMSRPELGYRLLGFADQAWAGLEEFRKSEYPLLCDIDGLAPFLRQTVVDKVVLALPM